LIGGIELRVLITGGFGFIGMYVSQRLLELGHEVLILDTLAEPPSGLEEAFKGVNFFRGDLLNQLSVFEAVEKNKIDSIIHMAALRNNDSQRNPYMAFKLNCEGTINCFETARICGIKRVVFPSSVAVLGKYEFYKKLGYNIHALPDDVPCKPTNVYGVTKLFGEMMSLQYNKLNEMSIVGVRLPIIFGAGKKGKSKTSSFNDMIEKSAQGKPITVSAEPGEKISIQYVKDSAKAVVCGCLAALDKRGIYNTGGAVVTMWEYAQAIKNVFPEANITIKEDPKAAIQVDTCIDNSLAMKEIGYCPDFTLEQGIEDHAKRI